MGRFYTTFLNHPQNSSAQPAVLHILSMSSLHFASNWGISDLHTVSSCSGTILMAAYGGILKILEQKVVYRNESFDSNGQDLYPSLLTSTSGRHSRVLQRLWSSDMVVLFPRLLGTRISEVTCLNPIEVRSITLFSRDEVSKKSSKSKQRSWFGSILSWAIRGWCFIGRAMRFFESKKIWDMECRSSITKERIFIRPSLLAPSS